MRGGWRRRPWLLGTIAGAVLLLPAGAAAQRGGPSLEQRLQRLERLMSSSAMMDLMESVQRLQTELQQLRGEVEQQTFTVEQLRQRQRELYLDVDRRLRRMEAGAARSPGVAAAPRAPVTAARPPVSAPTSRPRTAGPAQQAGVLPAPAASSIDPVKEQAAYQRAFNLLKEGRYDQAAGAFKSFLAEFDGGIYADNAQYWLGEAYYVTRQFEPALAEFQKLMEKYPASSKLTHAMLKVGYIYDEMGDKARARETLGELVANHPKTTAARLADERLRRMKQEGR